MPAIGAHRRRCASIATIATIAAATAAILATALTARAAPPAAHHQTIEGEDMRVFYREAGPANAPTVVLLHSFAASSYMFRNLVPQLAGK